MGLATQLRHKLATDPFFRARLRMTALFVGFSTITFLLGSMLNDELMHETLGTVLVDPAVTAQEALDRVEWVRWFMRALYVVVFSVGTYVLMSVVLQPVKESVESQRRFIANISHELRTPLALAKAQAEVALRPRLFSPERAADALKRTLEEINRVSRIIEFLLVMSDFTGQKARDSRQEVRLEDVVAAVVARSERMITESGTRLTTTLAAADASITGNPVALEKMLLNLVRNSAAYTPAGGSIDIALEKAPEGLIRLSVADTGSGMSAADAKRALEPFFRGKNARPGGTGLGLSIVREVAALHNASVRIVTKEGTGSTVIVEFLA